MYLGLITKGIAKPQTRLGITPFLQLPNGPATMADKATSIPAFQLPPSDFLSEASQQAIIKERAAQAAYYGEALETALADIDPDDWPTRRAIEAKTFYQSAVYKELLRRYPVDIKITFIGGVPCEVFTPREGLSPQHTTRCLINFHGGGFMGGSRTISRLESAPIAALMGIKVISVDYRMAPEHCHPAATDDAEAVYRALLNDYLPENLGVYGASAGAELTAMLLARLCKNAIPLPAAVGMFASGAFYWGGGDSGHIGLALVKGLRGIELGGLEGDAYYQGVTLDDAEAFAGLNPEVLARFPPALLISSSRDYILSAVIHTHTQLMKQGVETSLHLWDGLEHVFHYNPWLPESGEMHRAVVAFFNKQFNAE